MCVGSNGEEEGSVGRRDFMCKLEAVGRVEVEWGLRSEIGKIVCVCE